MVQLDEQRAAVWVDFDFTGLLGGLLNFLYAQAGPQRGISDCGCLRWLGRWRGPADFNIAEGLALEHRQLFEPDQFEQRQKGNHHFGTAGDTFEQVRKLQRRPFAGQAQQVFDFFAHRPFIIENVTQVLALIEPLQDGVDGVDQVSPSIYHRKCHAGPRAD